MSSFEIADNKWEVQAAKAPIGGAAAIMQMVLMAAFGVFFLYILSGAVYGALTPRQENSLAEKYKDLGSGSSAVPAATAAPGTAPVAAPAAAAPTVAPQAPPTPAQ